MCVCVCVCVWLFVRVGPFRVAPESSGLQCLKEPVWVVGRIVPDWETASGALNDQSVLLEGSREASGGARVRLDLSQLPSFRIFPGQVCTL